MDHQLENKEQMDNEILVDNMNQLTEFIKSTEEATINYKTYNEKLYTTHSQWLDYVKIQILEALKNSDSNINFSDINYDKSLLSLLNNIKKPHNYRNKKDNNITSNNSINQSIYKEEIFEKIDKLTNFNDIIDSLNSCSKYKRNSLLSKIHNDDDNNNNNRLRTTLYRLPFSAHQMKRSRMCRLPSKHSRTSEVPLAYQGRSDIPYGFPHGKGQYHR